MSHQAVQASNYLPIPNHPAAEKKETCTFCSIRKAKGRGITLPAPFGSPSVTLCSVCVCVVLPELPEEVWLHANAAPQRLRVHGVHHQSPEEDAEAAGAERDRGAGQGHGGGHEAASLRRPRRGQLQDLRRGPQVGPPGCHLQVSGASENSKGLFPQRVCAVVSLKAGRASALLRQGL